MNGTGLACPVVGTGAKPFSFAMIRYMFTGINSFNMG
jgi:hypothetical protein